MHCTIWYVPLKPLCSLTKLQQNEVYNFCKFFSPEELMVSYVSLPLGWAHLWNGPQGPSLSLGCPDLHHGRRALYHSHFSQVGSFLAVWLVFLKKFVYKAIMAYCNHIQYLPHFAIYLFIYLFISNIYTG